jgi:nucleoside-diphosphate-sugar epimerase
VPRNVLSVAGVLAAQAGRYVFMSSVSAYAGWPTEPLTETSAVLPCPPDAGSGYGTDTEDGPTRYGYQKSGCEAAAIKAFGASRVVVLRPGVVLGPREYVGRLPWWLRRVARGGKVIAPGTPDRAIQPIDVRDVADFAVSAIGGRNLAGVYNLTGPEGRDTFSGLLAACAGATGSDAEFVWTPDEVLNAHGVRQWSEMPLWRTARGVWAVDSSRAASAGLRCRPLAETVRDTWAWMQAAGDLGGHDRAAEIGLSAERERELLTAVARVPRAS